MAEIVNLIMAVVITVVIVLLLLIGLVVYAIVRRRRSRGRGADAEERRCLPLALSREDAVSQLFLTLATLFLAVTIFACNRSSGSPISWWTIFLVSTAIGFASAYSFKTPYTLALALIALAVWWGARAAVWVDEANCRPSPVFSVVALIMLLYYALGRVHGAMHRGRRFSLVYQLFGIVTVTLILFFFSTKPGLEALGGLTEGAAGSPWQITASLSVLLAVLAGSLIYSICAGSIFLTETIGVALIAVLFVSIACLPEQDIESGNALTPAGVQWAILFNIVVFLEMMALIFSGYLRREEWLINMGALFLFLLIIAKYFDWFFTSLDKSIFFIGAGILLFLVGWLMERGRRYMISGLRGAAEGNP